MKTSTHRRAPGFTLIELLVVITIIVILAAAGFGAGNAAMQRARKTTALNVATSLEQATNNFFNEYGYLPSEDTTDTVFQTDETTGVTLLEILSGKEDPNDPDLLNTKSINYLTVKEGKKAGARGRDGIIYNTSGEVTGIYDPWGGPYMIALDLDSNDKLDFNSLSPKPLGHSTRILNARRAAVWSAGADGGENGASGKGTDDVVTW